MRRSLTAAFAALPVAIGLIGAAAAPALAAPAAAPAAAGADASTVLPAGDPAVADAQTRLNIVGILTPVNGALDEPTVASIKHFQWKNMIKQTGELTPKTTKKLAKASKRTAVPELCLQAGKIVCADKTQRIIRLYKDGVLVKSFDARYGMPGMGTTEGLHKVFLKNKNQYSSAYNAPMKYSAFFKGSEALHHSVGFAASGYDGGSHGCINIRTYAEAKFVYNFIKIGTPVYVYK